MSPGESLKAVVAIDPPHLADPSLFFGLALLTLGIKRHPSANGGEVTEFREEVNGKTQRRFEFCFDSAGVDDVDTETWFKRWNDPEWMAKNIQHPLRWMKELAMNAEKFAVWMKEHDPVLVFRGTASSGGSGFRERIAYVPQSILDTERGREILRKAGFA